jgi:hypothetical protein
MKSLKIYYSENNGFHTNSNHDEFVYVYDETPIQNLIWTNANKLI